MRASTPGHGGSLSIPAPGIGRIYGSILERSAGTGRPTVRAHAEKRAGRAAAARDEIASARRTRKRVKLLGLTVTVYPLLLGATALVA